MAADVEILFDGIHPRVGERVLPIDPGVYPILPSERFTANPYGVLIHWPRHLGGWFHLQADSEGGKGPVRFLNQPQDLIQGIQTHQAERMPLAQEIATQEWVRANSFLIGTATRTNPVRLRFIIDTNNEGFVKKLDEAQVSNGVYLTVTVIYFAGSLPQPEGQTIRLLLSPGRPVPVSRALFAIDIGNTSTTAAVLDPFERDRDPKQPLTQRIPLLSSQLMNQGVRGGSIGFSSPKANPIPSELRFTKFRSWVSPGAEVNAARTFPDLEDHEDDDQPNAVEYLLGDLARVQNAPARSVIMGAKRMGCSRPVYKLGQTRATFHTYPIHAEHKIISESSNAKVLPNAVIQLDVRAPLELLASRIFQHFREDQRAWPAKIALTYPTTYSRYELQSLRRAVQKGWLRMQAIRQKPGQLLPQSDPLLAQYGRELQTVIHGPLDIENQSRDPIVQLLLDEASAAAFFFLYRKIFEEMEGGLAAFRYLYEQGLNMLLYDCGGGTTDIALVQATVGQDIRTLSITVLRRSGVRTFGGDDITRQLCRLLKAKIMGAIASDRKKPNLPMPVNIPNRAPTEKKAWLSLAAELEKFITAMSNLDPTDELVPTKTLTHQQPTEDRRAAALALWRIGEKLKYELSKENTGNSNSGNEVRLPILEQQTNALTRLIFPTEPDKIAQFKRRLETVTISRTELDALVYEPIEHSIRNCNKLIHEVFDKHIAEDDRPQEVHWVVASGNAVRYPLIQRMLRQQLAVPFLDDDQRFTFDPDNAKDATAKGAVLALASMESRGEQIDPRFESDLSDRLPFDVGYRNLIVGAPKILFEEHKHYRELKQRDPIRIDLAEVSGNAVQAKQFLMLRRFPGDDNFQNFLAFNFPDGIQGGFINVCYDDSSEFEFRVVDGEGNEGLIEDLTAGDLYRAPAQRGDI